MKLESTKKIINSDVYNIEEAEKIAVGTNLALDGEASIDELRYYAETRGEFVAEILYKTANGYYLIYSIGGNRSHYAEEYVTGMGAGSDIRLVDKKNIVSWMEQYNLVDDFQKFMRK